MFIETVFRVRTLYALTEIQIKLTKIYGRHSPLVRDIRKLSITNKNIKSKKATLKTIDHTLESPVRAGSEAVQISGEVALAFRRNSNITSISVIPNENQRIRIPYIEEFIEIHGIVEPHRKSRTDLASQRSIGDRRTGSRVRQRRILVRVDRSTAQ